MMESSVEAQAAKAIANLMHAVCAALHASGNRGAIMPMLTTFEQMNDGLIESAEILATLNAAVQLQKSILDQVEKL